ncbi:MAG: hypothetical protein F4052_06860 [Dehalococcoidia bacterium]|nr:hypothetical protein [Dehalococcoidia bacterium]MYK26651.1 hypothetical protein [Dehalococcoidia bacterium]
MRLQLVTVVGLGAVLFGALLFVDSRGEYDYVRAWWLHERPDVPPELDNEYRVCMTRVNRAATSPLSHGSAEVRAKFALKGYLACHREIVLGLP